METNTIIFKHFAIVLPEKKTDDFLKELNQLCTKYELGDDGASFEFSIE